MSLKKKKILLKKKGGFGTVCIAINRYNNIKRAAKMINK